MTAMARWVQRRGMPLAATATTPGIEEGAHPPQLALALPLRFAQRSVDWAIADRLVESGAEAPRP